MSSIKLSPNASGTGEFTIAAPNSNTNRTLNLPDASGTILTNSGTEAGAFSTLAVAGNNVSAVNGINFRNRIINGDMVIDQRNNGASVTLGAGNVYTVDRFVVQSSNGSRLSAQRNAGSVTPPSGFTNYLGLTSLSAYSVPAGEIFSLRQYIEGFNVADLGWGTANATTVTLSFWVRSSLTGTFGGSVNNNSNRSYPFTYTITAANTWERETITIPGDTSGTWATGNTTGLLLELGLGVGSTFSGTAGAWAGSYLSSATGATSVVGTNGATFYITGVQLEAGSVATPFERLPIGTELMLCQRYFNRLTNADVAITWLIGHNSNGAGIAAYPYPVVMRAAPSFSLSGQLEVYSGATGPIVYTSPSIQLGSRGLRTVLAGAPGSAGNAIHIDINSGSSVSLSAEL